MVFSQQFYDLIERGEDWVIDIDGVEWKIYKIHSTDIYYLKKDNSVIYNHKDVNEIVFCFLMILGKWEK
jgi:hypothetical protein